MANQNSLTLPEAIQRVQELVRQGTAESQYEAQQLCRQVLQVDAGNCNALFFLGLIEFNRKKFAEALEYVQKAIELNPEAPLLQSLLGSALFEIKRHAEAEAAFRRALSLHPDQPDVMLNLADALISQGKLSQAIETCDAVVLLNTGIARIYFLRAKALLALERFDEAITACRQAIEIDSNDGQSHYTNLGVLQQRLGLVQKAEESFRKALEAQPDYEPAHFYLADCLCTLNRTEEAITRYEALLKINPAYPDAVGLLDNTRRLLELEQRAHAKTRHLQPVFVLAPVARCGSTLLQRLLNSSNQLIMFGENKDIACRLPECVGFAVGTAGTAGLEENWGVLDNIGEYLAKGWFAGLFPGRGEAYLELALRNFYDAVEHYHRIAGKLGRAWGIKEPHSSQLAMLRRLLPHARFIFLYRNLFDVARSYKARGWLGSVFDVIRLAHDWREEICRAFLCGTDKVLTVKYEDLVENPGVELSRLEAFLGITGIDRALMKTKINSFEFDGRGEATSAYRAPQELTEEEHDELVKHARAMLNHLGYVDVNQFATR